MVSICPISPFLSRSPRNASLQLRDRMTRVVTCESPVHQKKKNRCTTNSRKLGSSRIVAVLAVVSAVLVLGLLAGRTSLCASAHVTCFSLSTSATIHGSANVTLKFHTALASVLSCLHLCHLFCSQESTSRSSGSAHCMIVSGLV